mmetsp:Transcript_31210/g.37141  ORF Transcript_31210/g.37141 Transcript_31210/m.37141 type:complete len:244 (-) Transcript_31210:5-736(-)
MRRIISATATVLTTLASLKSMSNASNEFTSIFDMPPKPPSDTTTTTTNNNNLPFSNDLHFLWSLSKDFGASGFRIGILYTQNQSLLRALANLNIFSGVSHPMQRIVSEVLTDDEFLDAFLEDGRKGLALSHGICTGKLEQMVIPYVSGSNAGLFVYANFSSVLPPCGSDGYGGGKGGVSKFEGERRFAKMVWEVAGVVLTPGESMRDSRPGWFRICYAWVTPEVLELAMERISRLVLQVRWRV